MTAATQSAALDSVDQALGVAPAKSELLQVPTSHGPGRNLRGHQREGSGPVLEKTALGDHGRFKDLGMGASMLPPPPRDAAAHAFNNQLRC